MSSIIGGKVGMMKQKWFCQMCQKQCKDDNGWKCHEKSETHKRMMELFRGDKSRYIAKYSADFEEAFISLIKRKYFRKEVNANKVYNDYIHAPIHDYVHLNSTKWSSLGAFILHLQSRGVIKVLGEENNSHLIKYNDPSAKSEEQKEEEERKEVDRLRREQQDSINYLSKKAKQLRREEVRREREAEKYLLDQRDVGTQEGPIAFSLDGESEGVQEERSRSIQDGVREMRRERKEESKKKQHTSVIDLVLHSRQEGKDTKRQEEQSQLVEEEVEDQGWLQEGIVVKILDKEAAGGKFYKKKAKIIATHEDDYVGSVEVLESGAKLQLDQSFLETVIPVSWEQYQKIESKVKVLAGSKRGEVGILQKISLENQTVKVEVEGKEMVYTFDEVCKLLEP